MIFETFAYRTKIAQQGELPDVYTYDDAPQQLRHQICVALHEGIGRFHIYAGYEMQNVAEANQGWKMIEECATRRFTLILNLIQAPL
jgi:hypothetical protein